MSEILNQLQSSWKSIKSEIWGVSHRLHGERMSPYNENLWRSTLFLWSAVIYDSRLLSSHSIRLIYPWVSLVNTMDAGVVLTCVKEADSLLLEIVGGKTQIQDYDSFKRCLRKDTVPIGRLLSPAKEGIVKLLQDGDAEAFASSHQILAFPSRLNFIGIDELQEQAAVAYLAKEAFLETWEVPECQELTRIWEKWLPRECKSSLDMHWVPHHGSGSVAKPDGHVGAVDTIYSKYQLMEFDATFKYLLKDIDVQIPEEWDATFQTCNRVAEVVFVPKAADKLRTICMEPATVQWIAEGYACALAHHIRNTPGLSRRICLKDQEYNRDLAWEGSIDGHLATVDLSEASDSVSYELIAHLTKNTGLREVCRLARSREYRLPDGHRGILRKFAPMGSALCFPCMCIMFASICELSIQEYGSDPHTSQYRVYGDDIVIESQYLPQLFKNLTKYGFSLNERKSYWNTDPDGFGFFRESCGGEYLNGDDVNPIRVSRRFQGLVATRDSKWNTSSIVGLIEMANRLYRRLPLTRLLVIHYLLKIPTRVFFSSDDLPDGIFVPPSQCTNWQSTRHYDVDYQEYTVEAGAVVPRCPSKDNLATDPARYYEWYLYARFHDFSRGATPRRDETILDYIDRVIVSSSNWSVCERKSRNEWKIVSRTIWS